MKYQRRHVMVWSVFLILATCNSRFAIARDSEQGGQAYLVGMGPGDPGLVTVKAKNVLEASDRVYCFGYLEHEVARFARPRTLDVASSLLMGRYRGMDPNSLEDDQRIKALQSEEEAASFISQIRQLIAAGKTVAIATAGDPTIFSPWSWVMDELTDAELSVIPGLSSFNAANAALRQSITGKGRAVLLSSGDNLGIADDSGRLTMMLVFFTQRTKLRQLVPRLLARYPADTPVAIVCEASYDSQKVVRATLGTVLSLIETRSLPHLYLVYVGNGLAHQLTPKL